MTVAELIWELNGMPQRSYFEQAARNLDQAKASQGLLLAPLDDVA